MQFSFRFGWRQRKASLFSSICFNTSSLIVNPVLQ
uniref:Uncharacterized protein n=1 Tax=Amphimedon queenslandica TaxID=400682 RepID=A0A1X7T6E4_AMPQE